MRPENTKPDLLLEDGEPVRCRFLYKDDPPVVWGDCAQNATVRLDSGEMVRIGQWCEEHPNRTIGMDPHYPYLCDTHADIWRDCI